jgi:hypothetical protein
MQYIWTGEWPDNRSPRIKSMRLNGKQAHNDIKLKAEETYPATFVVEDPDGDAIRYLWQVKTESDATEVGGDYEAGIANLTGLISDETAKDMQFTAPHIPGAYRLLVYAYDGHQHAAHANIPFFVEDQP